MENQFVKSADWHTPPTPVAENKITETLECDIAVVGLGYSGTAAVRSAAETGAKTIGIESRSEQAYSVFGGQIGHVNSNYLRSHGVPTVDPLELLNDWQLRSANRADARLVLNYAKHSGEAFDWLMEPVSDENRAKIHIRHWPTPDHHPASISGLKTWVGTACFHPAYGYSATDLMRDNLDAAKASGAELFFSLRAEYLERNDERITGLIAKKKDNSYIRIVANRGVILSAGDFSGNVDMVRELCVEITSLADTDEVIRGLGRDGSGVCMGMWAGGRLAPQPMAHMGGNYIYPNGVIGNTANVWLDSDGKRFCNEGFGDMVFSAIPGTRLPSGSVITSVFDSNIVEHMSYQQIGHCAMDTRSDADIQQLRDYMRQADEGGDVGVDIRCGGFVGRGRSNVVKLYSAETLEELGHRLGFEGENFTSFVKEIERYNDFCKNKRDEDFGKDPWLLLPINEAPYYGFRKESYLGNEFLCTVDGLWTDSDYRVLGYDKRPIRGLYAVGTNGGRLFGVQYSTPISGVCIGAAITSGYLAGRLAGET